MIFAYFSKALNDHYLIFIKAQILIEHITQLLENNNCTYNYKNRYCKL